MNLKIFFSPIDESVYEDIIDPTSFLKNISIFSETQPAYKGANMALIGVLGMVGLRLIKAPLKQPMKSGKSFIA